MSAYLKFFDLEHSPFEGEAQIVLGTRALRDALDMIQTGLAEGASRICVNGDRGLGKTSLARALPKLLGESARAALVLDPTLSWEACRDTLAKQWNLDAGRLARPQLLEAARNQRLVLVIDQAERASEEFLDHLDVVLSYRSEDGRPVVQSVLLARLTTSPGETPPALLWWLDRIQTLQLQFSPLPPEGIESYIQKHLKRAGWQGERLFSEDAVHAIHRRTGGIPGEVSRLCEELLARAAVQNCAAIDAVFVHSTYEADVKEEEGRAREDRFEELLLEEEIVNTDPPDADPLDAPPSQEELRAILGGGITPWLRNFAAAAIAAVVGGIGFTIFTADSEPARPADLSDSLARTAASTNRSNSDAPDPGGSDSAMISRARPTSTKPILSLQPGEGFVPIERLQGAGGRKTGSRPRNDPNADHRRAERAGLDGNIP